MDSLQDLLSHEAVADVVMYKPGEDSDFRAHVFMLSGQTINVVASNVSDLISEAYRAVVNSLELN